MTPRPTLLLHIGTHKTGTATLQALMEENRSDLARQGFCYPSTDRPPNAQLKHHTSIVYALNHGEDAVRTEREHLVKEFERSGCHTMLVSAEGLSMPRVVANLAALEILAPDFDIKVLCVLRRQDLFIESLWNQYAKVNKTMLHIDAFAAEAESVQHMTYVDTLDAWAKYGTVQALGFEACLTTGLVESFCAATGIVLPTDAKPRNVSPSMTCAAAMAALIRQQMNGRFWRVINKMIGPDTRRTALGSGLRGALLDRFSEHNVRLKQQYGVVFPSTLPDEPEEPIPAPVGEDLARFVDAVVQSGKTVSPRRLLNREKRRERGK